MGNSEEKLNFASHQTLACARSLLRRHHRGASPWPWRPSPRLWWSLFPCFTPFRGTCIPQSIDPPSMYRDMHTDPLSTNWGMHTDPLSTNRDMHPVFMDPLITNRFRFIYRFRLSCTFSGISHAMKLFLRQKR